MLFFKDYFRKIRVDIFPEVEDWAGDQMDKKNKATKYPQSVNYREWFFFSSDCFKLTYFGIFISGIINGVICVILAWVFSLTWLYYVGITLAIMTLYLIWRFWKTIILTWFGQLTFYDLFLRDDVTADNIKTAE